MELSNIDEIKEKFVRVVEYSQEFSTNHTQIYKLFDRWLEAKQWFIQKNKGKLIYESPNPVVFELSQSAKNKKVDAFIDDVFCYYGYQELGEFLNRQKQGFFDNVVINDDQTSDGKKIKKGQKLLKTFKYFVSNSIALDNLQTQASMIIQESKVEGTLCISVHPLDYLSVSNNAHKWRSCHSLDGEYRAGNLAYMVDPSTLICYLKGDKGDTYLTGFPDSVQWNSKKWRMLLFVSKSKDVMFAGRQYPFACDGAREAVLEHMKPILAQFDAFYGVFDCTGEWSHWHNDFINSVKKYDEYPEDGTYLNQKYRQIAGELYTEKQLFIEDKPALMFNDLTRSSCYVPYYCWSKTAIFDPQIFIGKEVPCLCCGSGVLTLTDSMMCEDCYESMNTSFISCENCGSTYREDEDEVFYVDSLGCYICNDCLRDDCCTCKECGEIYFKSDTVWDDKLNGPICYSCRRKEDEDGSTRQCSEGRGFSEDSTSLWPGLDWML